MIKSMRTEGDYMKVFKFISSSFVIVFAYFIVVKDSVWLYPYLHTSLGVMFLVTCIDHILLKNKGLAILNAVVSAIFFLVATSRFFLNH